MPLSMFAGPGGAATVASIMDGVGDCLGDACDLVEEVHTIPRMQRTHNETLVVLKTLDATDVEVVETVVSETLNLDLAKQPSMSIMALPPHLDRCDLLEAFLRQGLDGLVLHPTDLRGLYNAIYLL